MLKPKIKLNDRIRSVIYEQRQLTGKSAESVSESIGRAKSWLSQIENGRLQTINKTDFINLMSLLMQIPNEEAEKFIALIINSRNNKDVNTIANNNIEIYKVEDDEYDSVTLKNQFSEIENFVIKCFDYFFDNVPDKKESVNMISNFACNLEADLGFMFSVIAMKWDRMENTDIDTKRQLLREINTLLNKFGTTSSLDKKIEDTLSNS